MPFYDEGRNILRYPMYFKGELVTENHTLQADHEDQFVGVDTSSGDIVITIPHTTDVLAPKLFGVSKLTSDTNRVIIKLEDPNDSLQGSDRHAVICYEQGDGYFIILTANHKYRFIPWTDVPENMSEPEIMTLKPTVSGTTLTCKGDIGLLGPNLTVNAYFRYREDGTSSWTETTKVEKTATGTYSTTVTVASGKDWEVQALLEDEEGEVYYGVSLKTTTNYYYDTSAALADGLERLWKLQETSGTDTTGAEEIASDNMTFHNGVTIGSETINSNTIYHRIFGTADYGESPYSPDLKNIDHTIMIQAKISRGSEGHTLLSFGKNMLSVASSDSDLELKVGRSISKWTSSVPFSSIINLFIVADTAARVTKLYSVTTSATLRATVSKRPPNTALYTRIGRGTSGDSRHDDVEYLDDGIVRSVAVWNRKLTTNEMVDVVSVLDTDGGQIL